MFNLLNNAIKCTPANGSITLGAKIEGTNMCIWVADSGVCIPQEEQGHVFERFWQADNPLARQGGNGLGLSLVKSFVELRGGNVILDSALDKGTTVTCIFPVKHQASQEAAV